MESNILVCPKCKKKLFIINNSMECKNRHNYDLSKTGYVNLLNKKVNNIYESQMMFSARRYVYNKNLFAPIIDYLKTVIQEELDKSIVLEAGCGEGFLLSKLYESMNEKKFIGMDISKQAINKAAKKNKDIIWFVGDLCSIPLEDKSVDIIINMLTPANSAEFFRVLKNEGILIKIVPSEQHLLELRKRLKKDIYEKKDYGRSLSKNFGVIRKKSIKYKVECDQEMKKNIFYMTPLTTKENYVEFEENEITVDLEIIIAKVKGR